MHKLWGFAFVLVLGIASAARAEMEPLRTITVSGMAERHIAPDQAHIYVTLGAMKLKLADAKALHDAKLKKLYAITDAQSIGRNMLNTQQSSVNPHYTYDGAKQVFQGYRMSTTIDIKLTDVKKLGLLMEKITASGLEEANQQEYGQLLSVQYSFSDPDAIRDELLAQAITNARSKADRMARAAGASIGRVHQISEGDAPQFFPQPVPMMAMAEAREMKAGAADAAAPPVGEQEMRSTVSVIFELK